LYNDARALKDVFNPNDDMLFTLSSETTDKTPLETVPVPVHFPVSRLPDPKSSKNSKVELPLEELVALEFP
jgi:hypothetical protein